MNIQRRHYNWRLRDGNRTVCSEETPYNSSFLAESEAAIANGKLTKEQLESAKAEFNSIQATKLTEILQHLAMHQKELLKSILAQENIEL